VNVRALAALLPEVERRYPIDLKRLYLAGLSGTARAAWEFATRLKGHVAGIIGFGGGLPPGFTPAPDPGFVFFGGAGTTDFNYEEMQALDARLEHLGMPHRFRPYPGPHSWGPEEICTEAVDWMEIRAMRAGLRDIDPTLVEEFFTLSVARARAAEEAGRTHEAAERLRETATDLEGLRDLGDTLTRAAGLEKTKESRRTRSQMARHASEQKTYEARLSNFVARFNATTPPPALPDSLTFLQIASLRKRAGASVDPDDALAAQRLLELVAVYTGYYLPNDNLDRKEPGRALALLKIAQTISPDSPGVSLGLARARAQIGQKAEAIEDLRRAAAGGRLDAAGIESDPWLGPLRDEAGYRELLERLRTRVN
jgi:tetratricopeptide (TPR) repeat protein